MNQALAKKRTLQKKKVRSMVLARKVSMLNKSNQSGSPEKAESSVVQRRDASPMSTFRDRMLGKRSSILTSQKANQFMSVQKLDQQGISKFECQGTLNGYFEEREALNALDTFDST